MADITMPQLGETVTEGTITKWFKAVGDRVEEDELLFEVSTEKVDSEVPSPASGWLSEILVSEGDTVDVGEKLAVIADQEPGGAGGGGGGTETEAGEAAGAPPSANGDSGGDDGATGAQEDKPEPEVEREPEPAAARAEGGDQDGRSQARPGAKGGRGGGGGKLLSPLVRKLVVDNDLDVDEIRGSGQGGRITRADVLAHVDERASGSPPATAAPAGRAGAEPPRKAPAEPGQGARSPAAASAAPGDDIVVPFSNIRRRTAEHMVRSQATSAHVLVAIEVDFANVDKVRSAEKAAFKAEEGFSLTYLPFVARAVIDAIAEFPHVNASIGDDELIVHRRVHLGIAVDLSFEGLIVPVVRDADTKRLRAIARDVAGLAGRARAKKLQADEISGGTFTITNPGPFGTLLTAPVINQPQVAILSTDGVKKRPVAVELPDGSDAVAVHPVGNLALSFDHRAFDGAYASAFLARCKAGLEGRDWAQEM